MVKKKWYVREEQTAKKVWEYAVEAETEVEARKLVNDGEVECYDFTIEDDAPEEIFIVEVRELTDED